MSNTTALETIRSPWLEKISNALAQSERTKENFLQQLNIFYTFLQEAVVSGNSTNLDLLLDQWVQARTETELEAHESSLAPILNNMLVLTYDVIRTQLSAEDGLILLGVVLPVFTHALEFTQLQETQIYIRHVTEELGKTRLTLERLEKSKSDFISIAAHELKTPLTLIEGYSSMVQDLIPGESEQRNLANLYIKGINAGTRRLRDIVDDMIDVSLIDNDLLSVSFQPMWLNRILQLVARELEDVYKQRSQKLVVIPFSGSDEMIFGDGERLYQVFRNLITNAMKFTPDHGTIMVDGRMLPGFIEVTVSDTGIGIDPEFHALIFEKFGRLGDVSLHSSSKTKYKGGGPGLGLPIAKGIIEAHGGTIWVESEGCDEQKCPGSTFHVLLPLRKTPPDDKSAKLFRPLIEPSAQTSQSHGD